MQESGQSFIPFTFFENLYYSLPFLSPRSLYSMISNSKVGDSELSPKIVTQ